MQPARSKRERAQLRALMKQSARQGSHTSASATRRRASTKRQSDVRPESVCFFSQNKSAVSLCNEHRLPRLQQTERQRQSYFRPTVVPRHSLASSVNLNISSSFVIILNVYRKRLKKLKKRPSTRYTNIRLLQQAARCTTYLTQPFKIPRRKSQCKLFLNFVEAYHLVMPRLLSQ